MLNGIDVVYWINLDRSPDRRSSMNKLFADSDFDSLDVKRFSAIDYKNRDVLNYFNLKEVGQRNNRPEYACFLSHLETIRTFANSNYPDDAVALIMEDDATLDYKPYWKTSVSKVIKKAPPDWQIIMLGYMFSEGVRIPDLKKFPEYIPNNNKFVSAISYLIRKSTAKNFINKIYKNAQYRLNPNATSHHADVYLFNNLKTYAYKYPFFTYKTENDSYLHPDDLDNHKRCKLTISKILYRIDYSADSADNYSEGFIDRISTNTITNAKLILILMLILIFFIVVFLVFYMNITIFSNSDIFTYTKIKMKQYK